MADPVSVIVGMTGILSSVLKLSNPVIAMVGNMKRASSEIQSLSQDISAFFSVVRALDVALHEQEVRDIIQNDAAVLNQLGGLEESLQNCRIVILNLMTKHAEFERRGNAVGFRKLRWALFAKDEIRSLQLPLETMKSTLNNALSAMTILVGMRLLTTVRTPALSITYDQSEQVLDSVTSMVYQTQRSIMSNDRELCQQVVHLYRRLSERRGEMHQLEAAIAHRQQSNYDSSTLEVFTNFISRYSVNSSNCFAERLRESFVGSPNCPLGSSPLLYPEKLVTAAPTMRMSLSAILPLPGHPRTQRYFVNFQWQGRKWQRAIVVVTFDHFKDGASLLQASAVADLHLMIRQIPKRLQSPLRKLCREVESFGPVTNLFADLKENDKGEIDADLTKVEKTENALERHMSDEHKFIKEIGHLGCPQFRESQVVMAPRAQLSIHRYKVWVGDRTFTERKVPFATAGLQNGNLYDDFVSEVKRLTALRGCAGIIQFLGVVLDDANRHIKGYLYEAPIIPNLKLLISFINTKSKTIPWVLREQWIGQIITAMSNVHARGLSIGALNNNRISIRANGTIVLDLSEHAHRHLPTHRDRLPPELYRPGVTTSCSRIPKDTPLTFETDVYQLGFAIWLIAEHRPDSWGYYCTRAGCTNVPRYQCRSDHVEPAVLPPCSAGVPDYINDIITASRLPKPSDRPSASWLASLFPPTPTAATNTDINPNDHHESRSPGSEEALPPFAEKCMLDIIHEYSSLSAGYGGNCNECGALAVDSHYHCYSCDNGSFDLCAGCFEGVGIRCWKGEEHTMARITVKAGKEEDIN